MKLSNYSNFVCKCFENLVKDAKEKFSEDYFSYLINILRFSNGQMVIFLFALTHSKQLQISLNASSLLRLKLCQLTGESDFKNVADDILISFAQLILSSEVTCHLIFLIISTHFPPAIIRNRVYYLSYRNKSYKYCGLFISLISLMLSNMMIDYAVSCRHWDKIVHHQLIIFRK